MMITIEMSDTVQWRAAARVSVELDVFITGHGRRAVPSATAARQLRLHGSSGMTLRVNVIPRSARSEVVGKLADGTLKVRIAEAPERGRANEALIECLAEYFRVPRAAVTIASGHTASLKIV